MINDKSIKDFNIYASKVNVLYFVFVFVNGSKVARKAVRRWKHAPLLKSYDQNGDDRNGEKSEEEITDSNKWFNIWVMRGINEYWKMSKREGI